MATFSTNQVKHLYVAKSLPKNNPSAVGDLKFFSAGDGQIAAKYIGVDGAVRTDLIDTATLRMKTVEAVNQAQALKCAFVASTSAVAGQQYIIKVTVNHFGGMSPEDKGFIFGSYTAAAGDAAKNVLAGLAVNLAKNASRAAYNPLIKVFVTTSTPGSAVLGTNAWEVAANADPATVAAHGSLTAIIIEAAEQPWILGRAQYEFLDFSVATDPIISAGIETRWATITYAEFSNRIVNSKRIADLEYFCMGERGDIYRNVGWPNSFEFTPLIDPNNANGYDLVELTWAYQGDAEDIQKSPKELIIAIVANSTPDLADVTGRISDAIEGASTE